MRVCCVFIIILFSCNSQSDILKDLEGEWYLPQSEYTILYQGGDKFQTIKEDTCEFRFQFSERDMSFIVEVPESTLGVETTNTIEFERISNNHDTIFFTEEFLDSSIIMYRKKRN